MTSLCDVNVLVALLHARHVHSTCAVAWLDKQVSPSSVLVCRVAQMGALRILTNRQWLKEEALKASAFWKGWDLLMSDDRFLFVQEPEALETIWRDVTKSLAAGQNAGTDTYFAAFVKAAGYRLVTFDRGFRQFSGLDLEILR